MFGVVDQLLMRPPAGVGHADAVRRVYYASTAPRPGHDSRRASRLSDCRGRSAISVPAFAAAAATHLADVTLGAGAEAQRATAQLVDAEYFSLLELQPSAGRFFARPPAGSPSEPVVVLSHGFWRRAFASDPAIVGRQLRVENTLLTVAGIGAAGFSGLENRPVDLWVPAEILAPAILGPKWATNAEPLRVQSGGTPGTGCLSGGRRPASHRGAAARARVRATVRPRLESVHGAAAPAASPERDLRRRKSRPLAPGRRGAVLLVAIANVVSLLLTRAFSRRREIAMRIALGAGRARLLRQEIAESALLTAIAAIVALALTWIGRRLVERVLLPDFAWSESVVDLRVLAVTLAIALVTALAAGLAPALQAISTDALATLRTTARGASRRTGWFRTGLLVSQLALSVVLLIGAGLFIRSLGALARARRRDRSRPRDSDDAARSAWHATGRDRCALCGRRRPAGRSQWRRARRDRSCLRADVDVAGDDRC